MRQEEPFLARRLGGREGEGFRMPARGDLSARTEGRRPNPSPKALFGSPGSKDGLRVELSRSVAVIRMAAFGTQPRCGSSIRLSALKGEAAVWHTDLPLVLVTLLGHDWVPACTHAEQVELVRFFLLPPQVVSSCRTSGSARLA
jgi:hypothetical protein